MAEPNVRGQPHRRPVYLLLGRGSAAQVRLAAAPGNGEKLVFGPIRASRECRGAVRLLNDYFQLRACAERTPVRFADQREMFGTEHDVRCLRHALGNCLAPCAAACSSGRYAEQVRAATRFLRGGDLSALERLQEQMDTAAADQCYEEAAVYRDAWQALERLHTQLQRFRVAQQDYRFIYPVPKQEGRCSWYLIHRGRVRAALDEPRGRRAARRCLALIEQVYADRAQSVEEATRDDVEVTLLVAAWFRSRPDELQRVLPVEAAKDRLRAECASIC